MKLLILLFQYVWLTISGLWFDKCLFISNVSWAFVPLFNLYLIMARSDQERICFLKIKNQILYLSLTNFFLFYDLTHNMRYTFFFTRFINWPTNCLIVTTNRDINTELAYISPLIFLLCLNLLTTWMKCQFTLGSCSKFKYWRWPRTWNFLFLSVSFYFSIN